MSVYVDALMRCPGGWGPGKRDLAIAFGARELERHDFVAFIKRIHAERLRERDRERAVSDAGA